jgi:ParB/RepB/Spo0J family partition protein
VSAQQPPVSVQTMTVVMLLVGMIQPDPSNLRQVKDDDGLRDLALDVKRRSVLVPLIVRKVSERYGLIDGHRRLAAARMAGLSEVPCVVMGKDVTEAQIREMQLVTQLHSEALTPHETYVGLKNLRALYPDAPAKVLAGMISKTEGYVSMILSLDRCIQPVKDDAAAGKIGMKQWYRFSKLSPERQAEKMSGQEQPGEDETVTVGKIKCEVPGKNASIIISGKDISLSKAIEVVQEWLREAKKAAEQNLSAKSFERICKDKAKAG